MASTDGEPISVSTFHDDDQLASLYAAAKLGERLAHAIMEAFRNSRYRIFALEGDRLVEFQGKGYGGLILEALKREVRHHERVILYARRGKEGFYSKRGFNLMKTAMLWSFAVPVERNREDGIIE